MASEGPIILRVARIMVRGRPITAHEIIPRGLSTIRRRGPAIHRDPRTIRPGRTTAPECRTIRPAGRTILRDPRTTRLEGRTIPRRATTLRGPSTAPRRGSRTILPPGRAAIRHRHRMNRHEDPTTPPESTIIPPRARRAKHDRNHQERRLVRPAERSHARQRGRRVKWPSPSAPATRLTGWRDATGSRPQPSCARTTSRRLPRFSEVNGSSFPINPVLPLRRRPRRRRRHQPLRTCLPRHPPLLPWLEQGTEFTWWPPAKP